MSKTWRIVLILFVLLALIVGARLIFQNIEKPAISAAAEPILKLDLVSPLTGKPLQITNSLLTTWIAMLVLVLLALWIRSGIQTIPTRRQNLAEMLIDGFYNLVVSVGGEKWAPAFFPLVMTIFIFVLFSNLIDPLTPLLAAIYAEHPTEHGIEHIPLLRSPSTDLNFTLALALISVAFTQYYGVRANGFFGYLGKFINISGFVKFAQTLAGRRKGNPVGALFMGIIDFFIGVIELISEFAKIISFSFRLFGNIFAGEVLLLVIPFLVPFLIPLPFLGLELFVSLIQAFVFAVLTLAFMRMATLSHAEGKH